MIVLNGQISKIYTMADGSIRLAFDLSELPPEVFGSLYGVYRHQGEDLGKLILMTEEESSIFDEYRQEGNVLDILGSDD